MRRSLAIGVCGLPLALVVLPGCRDEKGPVRPSSIPMAVVKDQAPYLCDLVPESAFRLVTGLSFPVNAKWDGPHKKDGLCLAFAAGREAPLGVTWSYDDGEKILRLQHEKWRDQNAHRLPAALGDGLAVVIPTAGGIARPNYVVALFKCGGRRPWISIDFAPVVRGRDAVRDMVDFMRIAERRFGELHKCTPGAT